jgi:RNA polymerase sigma-70 factor (ECF subfamily)
MSGVSIDVLVRGDKAAWKQFVDEYSRNVFSVVIRMFRNRTGGADPASVDDVVADVFLRLIRNDYHLLKTYDPEKAPFHSWLALVTRSVTLNWMRAKKTYVEIDQVGDIERPTEPDPREEIAIPEGVLSDREALVVRLSFGHSYSISEIAEFLAITEQSVRNYKHRAINKLREHLDPGGEGRGDPG